MSLLKALSLPTANRPAAPTTKPPADGTAAKASPPSAGHAPATDRRKPHGPDAPATKVSPEARKFTELVMKTLLGIDQIAATGSPEAARLRKAVLEAANEGKAAKGRDVATLKLLGIATEARALGDRDKGRRSAEAAKKAAAKEERFDVTIGGKALKGATEGQICAELAKVLATLEADLKRGFEAHCYELQIQREEPFAAWVSGGVGALKATVHGEEQVDIMDLSIWDAPQQDLRDAQAALKRQDVDAVVALVPKIGAGCMSAAGKVSKHNADAIDSAQTAIDGLRKVEEVSADVVGAAAEKLGGEAAGIAVKAGYKSLQNAAEQASAVHIAEIQKEIDWGAVAKEGIASAASDIVGLLIKGPMAEKFSGLFGPYLKEADFGEAELAQMGKALGLDKAVSRDVLMTKAQRFVKDFLLEKGKGFVTSAVADAIKGKKESDPPMPIDELMADVAKGAVTDKLLAAFAEFVVAKAKK